MKILSRILCMLAVAVAMSGCLGKEETTYTNEVPMTQLFGYVNDPANGTTYINRNVGVKLNIDFVKQTVDITISNLALGSGGSMPELTMETLPYTVDKNGYMVVKATDIQPYASGLTGYPKFKTFDLMYLQRIFDGSANIPGMRMNITLEDGRTVLTSMAGQYVFAKTVVSGNTGAPYETTQTDYLLSFDFEHMTVDIVMTGAQFTDQMKAIDCTLPKISFTVSGNTASWAAAEVIPLLKDGTPFEQMKLNNVQGALTFCGDFNNAFDCAPIFVPGSRYHVEANGGLLPVSSGSTAE